MFSAGQSIGNYRILSKIGTGGMGAVYLAEHPLIGKRVALKVIHRELAGNKEVVQRFFQEARAVNQIGNEHVVEIHDFGVTPENDHFYIMEYLEGRTLASVLSREGRLEITRALHIGAQIAKALDAAHASGVIHRDLKPDNVMLMSRLGDHDFVKVLDFGLAKVFAEGASAVKTAAGVLLGTPQYMSPEACESKRNVDHRTDVYALGVLVFQMLTGVLPFDGESMGAVLVKQVTALPPAPRGINAAIPPSVEQVVLRCLAKNPDARFPTMTDLRQALLDPEAYLRASPPIAPARSVAPGEAGVTAKDVLAAVAAKASAASAPTMIAGQPPPRLPPDLAPPGALKNHTMRIATPVGYSSRPARKMWPIVLGLGLVLGLGGGAFAIAWYGRGADAKPGTEAGTQAGAGKPEDKPPESRPEPRPEAKPPEAKPETPPPETPPNPKVTVEPVPVDAPPAVVADANAMAKLSIDSVPRGASVIGPDGVDLGKTPLKFEWPVSPAKVTFELHLANHHKKVKELVVGGNTAISVELQRIHRPGGGRGASPGPTDNGLLRPE